MNERLNSLLISRVKELREVGLAKESELVITKIIAATEGKGPRYTVDGYGDKEFIKMNSNSYLGLSMRKEVLQSEELGSAQFGIGPGAVRFISGTYAPHIELEKRLASFHGREGGMIFSSAYVTSLGVIGALLTKETVVISDELNHNCIINAMRLARPALKLIYKHNDMSDLKSKLQEAVGKGKRCVVVTDGVFSMRGDFVPLREFEEICKSFNDEFEEGVTTIADDSHGVGAFGKTGRGTEEVTGGKVDILISTLGKAFGADGGYVVASQAIIDYVRNTALMYIYSNPISAGKAAAILKVFDILESDEGLAILAHISKMTQRFEKGLIENGFETIVGPHPVTPLMVRETRKTANIVAWLKKHGVLASGLNFPIVPKGSEEIRFQVNGDHTEKDIDFVIDVLKRFS